MKLAPHRLVLLFTMALAPVACSGDKDAEIARLKSELASKAAAGNKTKSDERPKLWRDEKIESAIKELGEYETVYVYRWQQAVLRGWVEVDDQGSPKQEPLDQGAEALKRGEKVEPKECSGELILALQKQPGAPAGTYQLKLSQRFVSKTGQDGQEVGARTTRTFKVKMDTSKGVGGGLQSYRDSWGNFTMKRFVGPKETTWLNLEVFEGEQ